MAGKQEGMNDPRGNIMMHCISVIKLKQPKYFILENVQGFMTNNKGATVTLLLDCLHEVGYTVYNKLLNMGDFGLPRIDHECISLEYEMTSINHFLSQHPQ